MPQATLRIEDREKNTYRLAERDAVRVFSADCRCGSGRGVG